jgi:subtilisin family serine protease
MGVKTMIEDRGYEGQSRGVGVGVTGEERAETTGRFLVVLEAESSPFEVLRRVAGIQSVAASSDFSSGVEAPTAPTDGGLVFERLGVAVVDADPDQVAALSTAGQDDGEYTGVRAFIPELIHHVMDTSSGYLQGYRDGVSSLVDRLISDWQGDAPAAPGARDSDAATWGLLATGTPTSPYSGQGIKLAVLDTGFAGTHPDFVGRNVVASSFVPGETSQDGHGHGTHCIGTACGPRTPAVGPRYGIAYEADIFVGKVLNNAGRGSDSQILAGIDWAVGSGCDLISMSLGADARQVSPAYVQVGRRVLDQGALIVAAAGNNARRPSDPGFVGVPANSPEIMAVAALDSSLNVGWFSARSLPGRGGQVDVAGPGVDVYSSWPLPKRYNTISGTSMATPHVAGLAALWAQATGRRARELWAALAQESDRLAAPSVDVGGGLMLAPQQST